ncbi:Six-hairpin glycosidase-like protein [Jimgerdemannia flammicorona]|uniref:Six-hairpin glycosidase-like protein n=1 Tax=Jimgerdemannia flammicorona TaxID=994334 RepID=A0A433CZJ1_9FUNG|nr:Six-hairpin glycosidase-like protein [Jimgerdemannia flammicorona]
MCSLDDDCDSVVAVCRVLQDFSGARLSDLRRGPFPGPPSGITDSLGSGSYSFHQVLQCVRLLVVPGKLRRHLAGFGKQVTTSIKHKTPPKPRFNSTYQKGKWKTNRPTPTGRRRQQTRALQRTLRMWRTQGATSGPEYTGLIACLSFLVGYLPIENYGIVGNLRTVALCGTDGSVDFMCYPKFDSPSVFCRLLDKDKFSFHTGHFSIMPKIHTSNKQQYFPNSNILCTRFLSEEGASQITDYMHIPEKDQHQYSKPLLPWLIRHVEVIRGEVTFRVECFPAFNYARDEHTTEIVDRKKRLLNNMVYTVDERPSFISPKKVVFRSPTLSMDLRWVVKCGENECPIFDFWIEDASDVGMKGPGVSTDITLKETQEIIFIFRELPPEVSECTAGQVPLPMARLDPPLTLDLLDALFRQTANYWHTWISQSTYRGRWREIVYRSALALKLLTYEPVSALVRQTGAVIASPTFGLPEGKILMTALNYMDILIPSFYPRMTHPNNFIFSCFIFWVVGCLDIGANRNWDYRYVWIRDSAFTVYAFMRLGLTEEAKTYMNFIEQRCNDLSTLYQLYYRHLTPRLINSTPSPLMFPPSKSQNPDGSLQIMYSIDGAKELPEIELTHLEGYRGSRPVRIGNGAYDHLQLDIYGELLDAMYLYNKYGTPISYDMWCLIRRLVSYVCENWRRDDMSIWEVRGKRQNFTYSKIMCWVTIDRALRLVEKRMFPCPDRFRWLAIRDEIYEDIMHKAWNPRRQIFTQSYESTDALDSAVLIMPLVFFISPSDPRFLSTVKQMLVPPEKGERLCHSCLFFILISISAVNLIHFLAESRLFLPSIHITSTPNRNFPPGLGGREGSFSMCTFWLVEALTRAGKYDKRLLSRALVMFEQMISYGNHLGLFSEEIARSGELLGNFPQAFTHLALISGSYIEYVVDLFLKSLYGQPHSTLTGSLLSINVSNVIGRV